MKGIIDKRRIRIEKEANQKRELIYSLENNFEFLRERSSSSDSEDSFNQAIDFEKISKFQMITGIQPEYEHETRTESFSEECSSSSETITSVSNISIHQHLIENV